MNQPAQCPRCGASLSPYAAAGDCPRCLLTAGLEEPAGPAGLSIAELQQLLPNLEILEQVGIGGMGVVYKARQRNLDRIVALKILQPREAEGFDERFAREARALACLTHPHIVALHEFGEAAGLYYLILEYVDGPNLRQVIAKQRLDPRQALAIVPQICEALQYAHDQGVVHRDIKPENVLLDRQGQVKITDFGLAKLLQISSEANNLTRDGQVMGTVHYMAPEQYQSPNHVDHRADIYSLGVVFYEMLTGQLPLGNFEPPSQKVAMDVRIDEVVLRALEQERDRRYQHVSDIGSKVDFISHSPPSEQKQAVPNGGRRTSKLALASFLVLFVIPVIFILSAPLSQEADDRRLSDLVGMLSFGLVAFAFIAAIVSCIRIPLSRGRLCGLGWAIPGLIFSFFGMGALTLAVAYVGVSEQPHADSSSEPTIAIEHSSKSIEGVPDWVPNEHRQEVLEDARLLFLDLQALDLRTAPDDVFLRTALYPKDQRLALRQMGVDDLDNLRKRGLIGGPLCIDQIQVGPLHDYQLDGIRFPTHASVPPGRYWMQISNDRVTVSIPLIYIISASISNRLRFSIGPVRLGIPAIGADENMAIFPASPEAGTVVGAPHLGDLERLELLAEIEVLWRRMRYHLDASNFYGIKDVAGNYINSDQIRLSAAPPEQIRLYTEEGTGGFPLFDPAMTPVPIFGYELDQIQLDAKGKKAEVRIRAGEHLLEFPVALERPNWRFCIGPVSIVKALTPSSAGN